MKEVVSQSPWVGKILTCKRCNRSYIIEPGDELSLECYKQRYFHYPARFDLPCKHYVEVDPIKIEQK